ncbi:MAG: zf-HC2 domain-containing protein [Oscillospiraceae bacterium]|nr:zf-HC2 domain-containing protein [Oscillospiraceae bacterium]
MKVHCDVIQDLLPLYADQACSEESRKLVEEHLAECDDCEKMYEMLKNSEIEDDLKLERSGVLEYGAREFRKQTAKYGGAISGAVLIPVLLCLGLNFVASGGFGWPFIVAASLLVAASLTLVPIFVKRDKAFWTFVSFCASIVVLLRVVSLAVHGNWFLIASSATLFGLSLFFLPFVIRARPLQPFIEGRNKALTVISIDVVLFFIMMTVINITLNYERMAMVFFIGCAAAVLCAIFGMIGKRGN